MPEMDETLTIAPRPILRPSPSTRNSLRSMTGRAARQVRNMLLRLTACIRSHSASLTSAVGVGETIPTLLCSTSSRPNRSRQASTIASTRSALLTSAAKVSAVPPSPAIMPAVSAAASGFISTASTFAPARAYSTAAALPLPQPGPIDPAPTTMTTRSCKFPLMAWFFLSIGYREWLAETGLRGQGLPWQGLPGRSQRSSRARPLAPRMPAMSDSGSPDARIALRVRAASNIG